MPGRPAFHGGSSIALNCDKSKSDQKMKTPARPHRRIPVIEILVDQPQCMRPRTQVFTAGESFSVSTHQPRDRGSPFSALLILRRRPNYQ